MKNQFENDPNHLQKIDLSDPELVKLRQDGVVEKPKNPNDQLQLMRAFGEEERKRLLADMERVSRIDENRIREELEAIKEIPDRKEKGSLPMTPDVPKAVEIKPEPENKSGFLEGAFRKIKGLFGSKKSERDNGRVANASIVSLSPDHSAPILSVGKSPNMNEGRERERKLLTLADFSREEQDKLADLLDNELKMKSRGALWEQMASGDTSILESYFPEERLGQEKLNVIRQEIIRTSVLRSPTAFFEHFKQVDREDTKVKTFLDLSGMRDIFTSVTADVILADDNGRVQDMILPNLVEFLSRSRWKENEESGKRERLEFFREVLGKLDTFGKPKDGRGKYRVSLPAFHCFGVGDKALSEAYFEYENGRSLNPSDTEDLRELKQYMDSLERRRKKVNEKQEEKS